MRQGLVVIRLRGGQIASVFGNLRLIGERDRQPAVIAGILGQFGGSQLAATLLPPGSVGSPRRIQILPSSKPAVAGRSYRQI